MSATTSSELNRATAHLAQVDDVLAALLDSGADPDPFHGESPVPAEKRFASMVLHIIGQQISIRVAEVIFGRLEAALGAPPTPEGVLKLGPEALRPLGMSQAKASYLVDLAQRESDGRLSLTEIHAYSDDEALTRLTAVRGIGLWSAQMFLLHQLQRPDIFPAGDVGLRKAVQRAWSLADVPSIKQVEQRAVAWSPYRTYAAALLWRSGGHLGGHQDDI
ncbi:hypothetical protein [Kribbella sp. NPDC049584]|uniref:DNA-3-methyladenine glycosylase family protein n=1 Tax=Kribbella sp. NPDC049584 TaxID=3154833 RepID=UPI00343EEF7E